MSDGQIDEMHRAASTLRTSGGFTVQLGDHGVQVAALCEVLPVAAIGREYGIGLPQAIADADGDGFLTDAQMNRRLHLVFVIEGFDAQFGLSDARHSAIEVNPQLSFFVFHSPPSATLAIRSRS